MTSQRARQRATTRISRKKQDLRPEFGRGQVDRILAGAGFCPPSERFLLLAVYRDGLRLTDLARLQGGSPRSLRFRLRRLVLRVLSDRFRRVARDLDRWPADRRRVATSCVLHGRSMRGAAAELGITIHRVRMEMRAIEALLDARDAQAERARSPGEQEDSEEALVAASAAPRSGSEAA